MLRFVVLSLCLALATSHLCLLYPPQRGSLSGVNEPGATDCALTTSSCGDRPEEQPSVAFQGNKLYHFTLQKNLNHYNPEGPGYLEISWAPPTDLFSRTILYRSSDFNTTSPWIIDAPVELPSAGTPTHIVILAQYRTNAPEPVPAAFYQCADILIYET
ncbi:uncharacterized protein [Oscarella lobularis]|uniref:uncharacterized protein n=1 Tax=Oscarella lobularis TaxID=121494 RepID=UPI003313F6CF